MKTIGLIGGMSWQSSVEYYRIVNEEVNKRLGGLHSAKCILFSVDFDETQRLQKAGEWEKAGHVLGEAAKSLEKAGADFIVICTNTMHKVVQTIEPYIQIPILHIADATGNQIQQAEIRKIGLLGTKYTMEQDFYKSRLESMGIQVVIPNKEERESINRVIFEELCFGDIQPTSREYYKRVIQNLIDQGAEGIILGCTEIGLLVKQADSKIPIFDTTKIHAMAAVDAALQGE